MKVYLTYSDKKYEKNRKFAVFMARLLGGFDSVVSYQPKDINIDFFLVNKKVLSQEKGGGYWLWKPYFINEELNSLEYGDYLFYSDSAVFMLGSINVLIDELEKNEQDIMGFELPLMEKQWTKKELFISMDCCYDKYVKTNQIMASYYLIKKTEFSVRFFKELLKISCKEDNITDKLNEKIMQDEDFIDHRHDQSIFSLLYKKYNLRPFKDPSQFGKYPGGYAGCKLSSLEKGKLYMLENGRKFRSYKYVEKYGVVLFHYRKGQPIFQYFKHKIKVFCTVLGLKRNDIS